MPGLPVNPFTGDPFPEPPAPADTHELFADMIDEGGFFSYGLRIVLAADAQGEMHTIWNYEGDIEPHSLIGVLEQIKLMVQLELLGVQSTDGDDAESD